MKLNPLAEKLIISVAAGMIVVYLRNRIKTQL